MDINSRVADVSAVTSWGFFGISFAQMNDALQTLALILTIIATAISIGMHIRNWLKPKN